MALQLKNQIRETREKMPRPEHRTTCVEREKKLKEHAKLKKAGIILLIFTLLAGIFPISVSAAGNPDFDRDLSRYLNEISTARGFEVTKEDIEAILSTYSDSLNNYKTVADLKDFLGEVIKADYSNLTYIYDEYGLDLDQLNRLLQENGEDLKDYIYVNNLIFAVYFYQEDKAVEKDPDFDQDLTEYLSQVSSERGFKVTKESLEEVLQNYDSGLEDFGTVEELSDYLGEVIKADLSNLDYFNETYGLDRTALLQLLKDNGKEIGGYVYVDDLEQFVWTSYDGVLPDFDNILDGLSEIFDKIGFTEEEFQNLTDYFNTNAEYFSDPGLEEKFEAIGGRLMALVGSAGTGVLTDGQISELASIYKDMLSCFRLNAVLTLDSNGTKTRVSFEEMLQAANKQDFKGSLLVEIYGGESQFLADILIKSDMFGSVGEVIEDTAGEITDTVKNPDVTKSEKPDGKVRTEKGGKLPKTASAYIPNAVFGLIAAGAGFILYRREKKSRT